MNFICKRNYYVEATDIIYICAMSNKPHILKTLQFIKGKEHTVVNEIWKDLSDETKDDLIIIINDTGIATLHPYIVNSFKITPFGLKVLKNNNILKEDCTINHEALEPDKYDWDKTKEYLTALPDTTEKIKYLITRKTEYEQQDSGILEFGTSFAQKCQLEINKLEALKKLEPKTIIPVRTKPQLGQYTNSQLVLIFYYFFKNNGLEPRKSIDIAPIAKFLHLVTGKEFKTVVSSDFYKKLQKVPNFKSDKELINDLEAIKPLFQKVQLTEIVKMIDNEIDLARSELRLIRKKQ